MNFLWPQLKEYAVSGTGIKKGKYKYNWKPFSDNRPEELRNVKHGELLPNITKTNTFIAIKYVVQYVSLESQKPYRVIPRTSTKFNHKLTGERIFPVARDGIKNLIKKVHNDCSIRHNTF